MRKDIVELWGVIIGLVVGFIVAKVYQIWAILFIYQGSRYAGIDGWFNTALWDVATRNPLAFLIVVEIIFAVLGYLFVRTFFKHIK